MKNKYILRINGVTYAGPFTCPIYRIFRLDKDAPNYKDQIQKLFELPGGTIDVTELDGTVVNHGLRLIAAERSSDGFELRTS